MAAFRASEFRVRAHPAVWRAVAGVLVAIAAAGLPFILLAVVVANDPPITPPILVRLMTILVALPGLAAWLIGRACAGVVVIRDGILVLDRGDLRVEIPAASITRIAPWIVPLPGSGLALWTRSGRRLRYGLQIADPTPLLRAMIAAGWAGAASAALEHPNVIFARARQSRRRGWSGNPLVKFVLFAMVPAGLFFNVHQHIAYGGPLGEYHLLGLAAYLRTLAVYWLTMAIYLVLYAAAWRGLAEGLNLLAAWVAPAWVTRVRQAAEVVCQAAFYGGVPALVAWRFLP